jgi:DNA polymerase I-like protein with 3'-5' exonuclease and polymerase domains
MNKISHPTDRDQFRCGRTDIAGRLLERGFVPVPLLFREKKPAIPEWQKLTREDVEARLQELFGKPCNIGVLLGTPSGGLIDIDLDCPEAARAAPLLLPPTGMVWGRPSRGSATHYGYRVDAPPAKASTPFIAPDGKRLVEVRSTGGQTLLWGEYPEGEEVGGSPLGEPARLAWRELEEKVRELAAAVLLACHWREGCRHELALAVSSGLLRAGWSAEQVQRFLRAVLEAAGDTEVADRLRAVEDTAEKIRRGEAVTGWPTLAERIGEKTARRIREWLGILSQPSGQSVGEWDGRSGGGEVLPDCPRYKIEHNTILAAKVEGREEKRVAVYYQLANFAALIRRQIAATDGVEREIVFELDVRLPHGSRKSVQVKASEFGGMNWVPRALGAEAIVAPGQNSRDQLRAAIQYLSQGEVTSATVYRHLGWTQIDSQWVYLHAEGGIGPDGPVVGVEVDVDRTLRPWVLPPPPSEHELRDCLRALRQLWEVGPERITIPTLLYALTCPLGQVDFSCYLTGPTGVFKTSWALVVLSLYGYSFPTPPIGWNSTGNALESLTFAAKDALLVIDDDAPASDRFSQRELAATVSRVLRSQGNAVGRARLRASGENTYDRPPRGGLLITGEDVPAGQSIRARCLFIEVQAGQIDPSRLKQAQKQAQQGVYARAMAAWVQYLARDWEGKRRQLQDRVEELREQWGTVHGRTATALARLAATAELFQEFAAGAGVDWPREQVEAALKGVVAVQVELQRLADPGERFVALLTDLLSGGRAHLRPRQDPQGCPEEPARWGWSWQTVGEGRWVPQGLCIGWVDEDGVYLNPSVAYAELSRLAEDNGPPLPTERTLWKLLAERGVIRTQCEDQTRRFTVRLRVGGIPQRVVWLQRRWLEGGISEKVGTVGTVGTKAENLGKNGGNAVPTSEGVPTPEWEQEQKVGTENPSNSSENPGGVPGVPTVPTPGDIPPWPDIAGADLAGEVGFSDTPFPPVLVTCPYWADWAEWITTPEGVAGLSRRLEGVDRLALDIETTGLDPNTDRLRLLSLALPDGTVAVIDLFAFSAPTAALEVLRPRLEQAELVGHNLAFDLAFLGRLGLRPARPPFDTLLASQLLHAGEVEDSGQPLPHDLAALLQRELGIALDKSLQRSDWSGELTPAQMDYAIEDVCHLLPLSERLRQKLQAAQLLSVAAVEMQALLTLTSARPIRLDVAAWAALTERAEAEAERLAEEMNRLAAPALRVADAPTGVTLFPELSPPAINWDSPVKVKQAFASFGITLSDTRDKTLAGIEHPLADLLRRYRHQRKRVSAFGLGWLREYVKDGCVAPQWRLLGAESGRMSCAHPNLQQIPREAEYRRCFVAREGHRFIKADYSQIELRLAAKVALEQRMIEAFIQRIDLHALTASRLLDKPLSQVSKGDRQLAKAVNFGLLYGMSPRGLREYARANYGVELSEAEAKQAHRSFFAAYPALRAWHERLIAELERCGPEGVYEARTLFGRRRFLPAYKAGRPNLTEAANFQVQGLAADGLKAALALMWQRREECPEAVPVLFVHDEVVIEVPEGRAGAVATHEVEAAREWLIGCLKDGMQPLAEEVPIEVEAVIATSWER